MLQDSEADDAVRRDPLIRRRRRRRVPGSRASRGQAKRPRVGRRSDVRFSEKMGVSITAHFFVYKKIKWQQKSAARAGV